MDQIKIGKFISASRKKQNLTQEQLAEQLNVSKNAVSKWERGLILPDVSIMQDLCVVLDITLNELFSGEKINDANYKELTDNNLLEALEHSSFSLKEKIKFYKKKWIKMHIPNFIVTFMILIGLAIVLKFQNVDSFVSGAIVGILSSSFCIIFYKNMMTYVENNVYKKIEKNDNTN